jgi:hypothetical protein
MFIAHQDRQGQNLLGAKSPTFETINLFKELMDYLDHAPEHDKVETLLAEFSARLARLNGEWFCVGLLKDDYKMLEAIKLFRLYGVGFSFKTVTQSKRIIYARARDVKTLDEKDDEFVFSRSKLTVKRPALQEAA